LEESNDFQYNLMTLFADGGLMMYALVLCSLIALGVIIAKAWTLWVAHRDTDRVLAEVKELAEKGRIEEAIRVAAETPGPAAAILLAGLRRIRQGRVRSGEIEQAVSTTGTIELGFLERGLVILATIANVAPLMGFLGTVAGMILAFASIELAGDVNPTLVAGGIKVALLTTATGLLIAIPVNLGYNFFVTRIDKLIIDMEQGTQQILNLAWDMEKAGSLVVTNTAVPVDPISVATPEVSTRPASPPAPEAKGSELKDGPGASGV
jgi:biopolymer transport protein ExbB